jgi:hypothetical protein
LLLAGDGGSNVGSLFEVDQARGSVPLAEGSNQFPPVFLETSVQVIHGTEVENACVA